MEFVFPWPMSQSEWLAFAAAVASIAYGLGGLIGLLFTHFPTALAARAQAAGLQAGVALTAILMAQPLVYLALGAGWALAVIVQLIAMARHGRAGAGSLMALIAGVALAVLPIGHVFGLF